MNRLRLLNRIITAFFVFLVPVFFTTLTSEFFEFPKTYLVFSFAALALLLLGFKFFLTRRFEIVHTPFDLVLILTLVSLGLSTYFGANRVQSSINGLAPLAAVILIFFFIVNLLSPFEESDFEAVKNGLVSGTALVAGLAFLAYFNLHLLPFDFAKSRFFNLTGSDVSLITLLGLVSPLALGNLLSPKAKPKSPWFAVNVLAVSLFALLTLLETSLLGVFLSLPSLAMLLLSDRETLRQRRTLLGSLALALAVAAVLFYVPLSFNKPFTDFRNSFPRSVALDARSSWIVSVQTIRDYPFFGSGPATYLADYVRYRPLYLNYTPFWTQRFPQSSGYPYQVLATLGVVGLLVFLFFLWKLLVLLVQTSRFNEARREGINYFLLVFIIALFFSVPSYFVLAIFFTFLGLFILKSFKDLPAKEVRLPIAVPVVLILFAVFAFGYFFLYPTFAAEVSFRKAIDSVTASDTQGAYNNLLRAEQLNPRRDNYHLSMASLAYSLANNLAAKKNLTDTDRQSLIQLLNTSISEAKLAVSLDPFNGTNLETLASIYRNIAGAVQNAGNWSVTAYQQAMNIEPANPNLPFQLGSLFFAAGNYEAAANLFSQTVQLKNDFPNYHYNLAWSLRMRGFYGSAVDEMTLVTRMVDPASPDGKKAAADLSDFNKLLQDALAKSGNQPARPPTSGELEVQPATGTLASPDAQPVDLPTEASPSNVKRK